ncbi:MAG: glycosyltransferase family 4 protein [Bdellovibrionales bacterium]|nr:glycosyltransferase family 4 protein [Bdellovibrionales bacterium]
MTRIAVTTDAIRERPDGIGIVSRHWVRLLLDSDLEVELWDYQFSGDAQKVNFPKRELKNSWPCLRAGLWNAFLPFQARSFLQDYRTILTLSGLPPVVGSLERFMPAIYDIIDLKYPEIQRLGRAKKAYLQRTLPYALKRVRKILAISSFTANDIVRSLEISPSRIEVVPLGPSFGDIVPKDCPEKVGKIRGKFGLRDPFLLMVGTIHPRKNHTMVLSILEALMAKGFRVDLVVAGQRGWKDSEFQAQLGRSPVKERVQVLGYVDDDSLWQLYREAELLLYPSIYEGFGLPVLDAMALGCPVVTSVNSPMAEIGGQAVLAADPRSYEDLLMTVESVLTEKSLQQELVARGLERAETFTWGNARSSLLSALQ